MSMFSWPDLDDVKASIWPMLCLGGEVIPPKPSLKGESAGSDCEGCDDEVVTG